MLLKLLVRYSKYVTLKQTDSYEFNDKINAFPLNLPKTKQKKEKIDLYKFNDNLELAWFEPAYRGIQD